MYVPLERVTLIIASYFAFSVMYLFQVFLLSFIKYAQPTQPPVSVEISFFYKQATSTISVCIMYQVNLLKVIQFYIYLIPV